MEHPLWIVMPRVPPICLFHIRCGRGDARARDAQWHQDEPLKRGVEVRFCRALDQVSHEEISDIRIGPSIARCEEELSDIAASKQVIDRPHRISICNGCLVGSPSVRRQSRRMLQQVPDGEWPIFIEIVQPECPHLGQLQHGGGQHRFRDTPPRQRHRGLTLGFP